MSFDWLTWSNPVAIWWVFLVSVSILNILLWLWTRAYLYKNVGFSETLKWFHSPRVLIWFSGAYVFGCAFRSFLPRADVQRIVLFDTWFSSVFVGRSVATVAELSFVLQWAIVLYTLSQFTKSNTVRITSKIIVPLIAIAEICSWYAVITTSYLGNAIEESLWAVTYAIIAFSLWNLKKYLKGILKKTALVGILGCFLYVGFMVFVDVPMYLKRMADDQLIEKSLYGLLSGIKDLNTRWVVTHDIHQWREEIAWMSLYFSAAVWVSLALCYIPLNKERLSPYLEETAIS